MSTKNKQSDWTKNAHLAEQAQASQKEERKQNAKEIPADLAAILNEYESKHGKKSDFELEDIKAAIKEMARVCDLAIPLVEKAVAEIDSFIEKNIDAHEDIKQGVIFNAQLNIYTSMLSATICMIARKNPIGGIQAVENVTKELKQSIAKRFLKGDLQ